LIGFVAAVLLSLMALGQPVLADVIAPEVECCSVAPNSLFRGLKHADEGIQPYTVQRTVAAGHGGEIQADHLIERRFADVMGGNTD
jgi:hypothetical protein